MNILLVISSFLNFFSTFFKKELSTLNIFIITVLLKGLIRVFNLSNFIVNSTTTIDISIISLMLILGSHLNVMYIFNNVKLVIGIISLTLLNTVIIKYLIESIVKISSLDAFILSGMLCLSSTIVCNSALKGNLSTEYGQLILFSTIIQDLIGLAIIVLISYLKHETFLNIIKNRLLNKNYTIILFLLLFFIIFYLSYKEKINKKVSSIKDNLVKKSSIFSKSVDSYSFYSGIISLSIIVFYVSNLIELKLNIPKEITFLIVGFLLKNSFDKVDFLAIPIQSIFTVTLLIYSFSKIQLSTINYFPLILLVVVVISLIKFVITWFVIKILLGNDLVKSTKSSLLLISFSEMIFFILPNVDGLIKYEDKIALGVLISMFLSRFLFNFYENYLSIQTGLNVMSNLIEKLENFILIINIESITEDLADILGMNRKYTIVLDNRLNKIKELKKSNYFFINVYSKANYRNFILDKVSCVIINCLKYDSRTITLVKYLISLKTNLNIFIICNIKEVNKYVEVKCNFLLIDETISEIDNSIKFVKDIIKRI